MNKFQTTVASLPLLFGLASCAGTVNDIKSNTEALRTRVATALAPSTAASAPVAAASAPASAPVKACDAYTQLRVSAQTRATGAAATTGLAGRFGGALGAAAAQIATKPSADSSTSPAKIAEARAACVEEVKADANISCAEKPTPAARTACVTNAVRYAPALQTTLPAVPAVPGLNR